MGFPLKDWIDAHPRVRHHLSRSGMYRGLASTARALADPLPPDEDSLRQELGRHLRVPARRVFLTHGATEANSLALAFLRTVAVRRNGTPPSFRTPRVEYPPLAAAATWAGFRPARGRVDVAILSDPNNPTGQRLSDADWRDMVRAADATIVDETFREFGTAPSRAVSAGRNVWATGTFTKTYGGDPIRVGWVIAPDRVRESFGEFHGIVLDELPLASVGHARSLLRRRREVLAEVRGIVAGNRESLVARVPEAPADGAPLWFDRGRRGLDDWPLSRRLLRSSVLVSPGSFFGDPTGIRVCLTQRSFPADLAAYLAVRDRAA